MVPTRASVALTLAALALLVAACTPAEQPASAHADTAPADAPAQASPAETPDGTADAPESGAPHGRVSRYTDISDCPVVVSRPDEAGYRVTECAGPAGHAVRVSEADGRYNLLVRAHGQEFVSLRIPEHTGGGFSRIDGRVEWRGSEVDGAFAPDVLVLRYLVAEDPANPERETSYLVPVRLAAPGPCIAALIAPGADQSTQARALADADPGCLER